LKTLLFVMLGLSFAFPQDSHAKPASVDCELLRRAASASRAAYTLFEQKRPTDPTLLATFSGTQKLGGFAVLRQADEGWCELAFKGTDITDPEDLLLDLAAAIPAQCGRRGKEALGVCAAGFFIQYLSIRNKNNLFAALDKQRAKGHCKKGLLVTGHSLGGALASIFAADAVTQEPAQYSKSRLRVVTFAEPRVFGTTPADRFNRLVDKQRIINFGDKIAAVPMKKLGFKHFGRVLHLHKPLFGMEKGRLAIREETTDFAPEHAGIWTIAYHALLAYELRLKLCSP
jgi:predicted lipase